MINQKSVTCVSVLGSSKQGSLVVVVVEVVVVVSVKMIGFVFHGSGRGGVGGVG